MKYTTRSVLLAGFSALTVLALASAATATIIVHDDFSVDGTLTGSLPDVGSVWTNHSGTVGQTQVVGGQARLVHPTQSEDNHSKFVGGPIGAGAVVYSGFDLTVPSQTTPISDVYFAHFKDAGNFFGSRVFITAPTTSGYRLGISGNGTLIAGEKWATDLAFDTTYRVVTSYNYDTGVPTLWINPVTQASTSLSAGDGIAGDEMEAYAFRQSSSTSSQLIDCLVVATTFDEANECPIPEPASVALALIAGLGLVGFRRRYA